MCCRQTPHSRVSPGKVLLAVVVLWGLAALPLSQVSQAASTSTPKIIQERGSGDSGIPEAGRLRGLQLTGDPDEYTQTGGSNPRPSPGGTPTSLHILWLDFLRSRLMLVAVALFG